MKNIIELQELFENNQIELPKILRLIAEFQMANDNCSPSGEFRIDVSEMGFRNLPFRSSFVNFGTDYCGGVFALWSGRNDIPLSSVQLEAVPIIYLDDDAIYSTVICNSLSEFVSLLMFAESDLGETAAYDEQFQFWENPRNPLSVEFRKWAKESLGVELPNDGRELVRRAKRKFQIEFLEFYRKWQGEDPWTEII
jgi:hypothetical protein